MPSPLIFWGSTYVLTPREPSIIEYKPLNQKATNNESKDFIYYSSRNYIKIKLSLDSSCLCQGNKGNLIEWLKQQVYEKGGLMPLE